MIDADNVSSDRATWWQAALLIRGQTQADERNIRAIWIWSVAWGVSFSAVTVALKLLPQLSAPLAWVLAAIPTVLGVPLIRVHLRFLREADEFMRKIQLEGIAMGFAAGGIFCLGYHALEQVGAPELPIIFATVPLALGWVIGSFLVAARHR